MRKSEKFTDSQPQNGNLEATFQSWLPNSTTEKPLEKQPDQLNPPIKLFEEWENESDPSPHSSNRDCYTASSSSTASLIFHVRMSWWHWLQISVRKDVSFNSITRHLLIATDEDIDMLKKACEGFSVNLESGFCPWKQAPGPAYFFPSI